MKKEIILYSVEIDLEVDVETGGDLEQYSFVNFIRENFNSVPGWKIKSATYSEINRKGKK